MNTIVHFTEAEVRENHISYLNRLSIYREQGLDHVQSRKAVIDKVVLKGSILELGSGNGHTSLAIAQTGNTFTVMDCDPAMIRSTALHLAYYNFLNNVQFLLGDIHKISFNDSSFDYVIAVNVMHHLNKVEEVFSEMCRITKQNGQILIADFTQYGMEIINQVHIQEGREHIYSNLDQLEIRKWFEKKHYRVTEFNDICYWTYIVQRV